MHNPDSKTYTFPSGLVLPEDTVRDIYRAYSDRAAGLSASETAVRVGLSHETVRYVLKTLQITHMSPPVAPHEPQTVGAMASAVDATHLGASWDEQAAGYWRKRAEKAERERDNARGWIREAFSDMPALARPDVEPAPRNTDESPWTPVLVWSDWHVGHHTEALEHRLVRLMDRTRRILTCSRRPIDRVIVLTAGDMVDGAGEPLGGPGVHGLLAQDVRGPSQIAHAATLMAQCVQFVARLHPRVVVHSVHGNHDRTTRSADADRIGLAGWAACWGASLLCRDVVEAWHVADSVPGVVPVDLREYGTRLLVHHGHNATRDAHALATVWRDERWIEHIGTINGHYHHTALRHWSDTQITHFQCGSPVGPTDDKSRVGKSSWPEQSILGVDEDGPFLRRVIRLNSRALAR